MLGVGGAALVVWAFVTRVRTTTHVPTGFWYRAVEFFGGRPIDPAVYPQTIEGLESYLRQSRVGSFFGAQDVIRPNHATVALSLGYTHFLPPHEWWPRTAALVAVANQLALRAGGFATTRNFWRPAAYNNHPTVDGAADSAHIENAAVDVDFASESGRRAATEWIQGIQQAEPWLKIGLGVGSRTVHVDMLTDKPQRPNTWSY